MQSAFDETVADGFCAPEIFAHDTRISKQVNIFRVEDSSFIKSDKV
jgi:hypothetical protein